MKYKVVNELDHFEYHDANIVSQERKNGCIEWTLHLLNATTMVSVCDFDEDMRIQEAHLLFEQVVVEDIGVYEYAGNKVVNGQTVHYNELCKKPLEAAEEVLQHTENSRYRRISSANHTQADGRWHVSFEIENEYEFFVITFRYKSATVEWDEYQGIAWYMKYRNKE